jgi:hypothetical protein
VNLATIWSKSNQNDGFYRIETNCQNNLKTAQRKIFRDLSSTIRGWVKLSQDKKYELSFEPLIDYLKNETDKDNSLLIDEALRDVYRAGYIEPLPYCLSDVFSWKHKTGLKDNPTPGYFFARSLVNGSKTQVYNIFN